MNHKRLLRFVTLSFVSLLCLSCSKDDTADNREPDYGYVQFKLYKEASYAGSIETQSRAVKPTLDYLNEASKITVYLNYGESSVSQTVNLTAADNDTAEYGLRSDKIKLLTGHYSMTGFDLYDATDGLLYTSTVRDVAFGVVSGGLETCDLTVSVTPRGKARFTLYKANIDKGAYAQQANTRAEYTFDEVKRATITVQDVNTAGNRHTFSNLKMTFKEIFDENNEQDGTFGYRTSIIECDSIFSLPAGNYSILSYTLQSSYGTQLEARTASSANPIPGNFTIEDNKLTDVKIGVNIDLSADYISDYLALKKIWEALDGPNWYYNGQVYTKGCNWDFNKDIDLWGDQPGIHLHSNGRVARLDLSDFGPRGDMPDELGNLTELVELYLGTHNDVNTTFKDEYLEASLSERHANKMQYQKRYLSLLHPAPQMSEPCARGLREHNIVVPETALYEMGYTENELIDPRTGLCNTLHLYDTSAGKICNGITSLPHTIGNLKKLEYLYIANGKIRELPAEIGDLESLVDLEIYNCPEMTKFPTEIGNLPLLGLLNISNNPQWTADEIYKGLDALASGAANASLQIIYATNNNLEEVPESFNQFKKLGMLDFTHNKIRKLHPLGKSVALVQAYFDHNQIEEFPVDSEGYFCQMNDIETFAAGYNKLTEVPNIFKTNDGFVMSSVDLSMNQITKFPDDFKGIQVTTLTLTGNKFEEFPNVLFNKSGSTVSYIIMRGNSLKGFQKDCFVGKNVHNLMSLDLSYNHLTKLPDDFVATNMPYLYGVELSHNAFSEFPYRPFDAYTLTIFAIRAQRDEEGRRCLREWPTGVYQHTGLRALYLGSNDIRTVNDTISYMIYYLDISDNPNITFDASDICAYWRAGLYLLIYDKTQNIINCEAMLQ